VLRSDWSEIRADLMVRTGDHCDDSVSKQIAPWLVSSGTCGRTCWTYGLRADIGMPDLGLEAHDGRSERVFARDLDVHGECAALVRRVWRPVELAAEVCEVIAVAGGLDDDLGVLVVLDVGNLLCDAPGSVGGRHCESVRVDGGEDLLCGRRGGRGMRSRQQVAVAMVSLRLRRRRGLLRGLWRRAVLRAWTV
jgi:hypothetical protein